MKRRRSRRKPNFYVKPVRTQEDVNERTRQMRAGGTHGKKKRDRWNGERLAREQEKDDNI